MIAQIAPERDFRGPGCGERCEVVRAIVPGRVGRSELLLHDPATHERYGLLRSSRTSVVGNPVIHTGGLVIDRWERRAISYGVDLELSGREWEILDYLAANAGRYCPTPEIVGAVWGTWPDPHILHVFLMRLRTRLASCGHLIETRKTHGYRLRVEPPITSERAPAPVRRWARAHDFCACCGKTRNPHVMHGRCVRCIRSPSHRALHFGPCGAPPAERT